METLYSLEVFVSQINGIPGSCAKPGVGFRFLDFPTVIIYPRNVPASNESSNQYLFNSGKSCLFKMEEEVLYIKMKSTPLYVILFDYSSEKSKLLGTCGLSLLDILEQLEKFKYSFGSDIPMVGEIKCNIDICNLMSTYICQVAVQVKLTSFGKSLLTHSTKEKSKLQKIDLLLNDYSPKNFKPHFDNGKAENPVPMIDKKEALKTKEFACQTLAEENGSKSSKTPKHKVRKMIRQKRDNHQNEDFFRDYENNIFCPPPLFLNLHITNEVNYTRKNVKQSSSSPRNFLLEDEFSDTLSSDEEPYVEICENNKVIKSDYMKSSLKNDIHISVLKARKINKNPVMHEYDHPENIVKALPTLTSLLKEITNILNMKEEPPCDCKIQKIPEIPYKKPYKETNEKDLIVYSENDNTTDDVKTKVPSIENKMSKKKNISEKARYNSANRKPIKKLKYGDTRTQKLRKEVNLKKKQLSNKSNDEDSQKRSIIQSNGDRINKNSISQTHQLNKDLIGQFQPLHSSIVDDSVMTNKHSKERPNNFRRSVSITIPTPDIINQTETDSEGEFSSRKSADAGFYTPLKPDYITKSELGEVDDQETWSSVNNLNNETSDGVHSDTSSISLPQMSEQSIESQKYARQTSGNDSKHTLQSNYSLNRSSRRSFSRFSNYSENFEQSETSIGGRSTNLSNPCKTRNSSRQSLKKSFGTPNSFQNDINSSRLSTHENDLDSNYSSDSLA